MKQTFYLHEYSDGGVLLSRKPAPGAKELIGTIELDVQPVKKEVEKEFPVTSFMNYGNDLKKIDHYLPGDAYDVTYSYKRKE
jgi:hypothetical protein